MPGLQHTDSSLESEERFRALAQAAWEGIAFSRSGVIIDANPQLAEILGYTRAELIGKQVLDLVAPGSHATVLRAARLATSDAHEHQALKKDGTIITVEVRAQTVRYRGELVRMAAIRDISERTRANERRRALVAGTAGVSGQHFFRSLVKHLARALEAKCAFVGEVVAADPARVRSLSAWVSDTYVPSLDFAVAGTPSGEVLAHGLRVYDEDVQDLFPDDAILRGLGAVGYAGIPLYDTAGATLGVLAVAHDAPLRLDDNLVSTLRIFAARAGVELERIRAEEQRRHAEAEVLALEAQLRHSQKLEAVGQLAGGIAHDFNNLLTVINGYCERLLVSGHEADGIKSDLELIHKAGQRAAGLTRQLLAFSRRQVLQPRVIDLNAIVADIQRILARVIGEQNTVVTALDPALGSAEADPGQIEQVIMNLAINARDAMADGGIITIQTGNVAVAEGEASPFHLRPGQYVMLAIRDTGHGMDAETASRIFEPFFTTKDAGKGTGLGLSTVYGIVAQSGGDIAVESAVGEGTTMRVFLPRVARPATTAPAAAMAPPPSGHETVLLVEDEAFVRELVREFLQTSGYQVIEASCAEDALRMVSDRATPSIDLLVTDVVLPGLNGVRLAERLKAQVPGLEALYISGYPGDAMFRGDVFDPGPAFLAKPFTRHVLTQKVREILNARPALDPVHEPRLAPAQ
jgi:two-component system cell cycle sensor histidine kinase/response regulator CckA